MKIVRRDEKNVRGLEVAMNDPDTVRRAQGFDHLHD